MIKRWIFEFDRVALILKVSDELWFDTTKNDSRIINVFRVGWLKDSRYPSIKIFVITLPWISVKVAW